MKINKINFRFSVAGAIFDFKCSINKQIINRKNNKK